MKTRPQQLNRRGFTLLLTLMALILLASLIVQFQVDSTMHIRSSDFRQEKIQCQYAAESALIIAPYLIKEALAQQRNPKDKTSPESGNPDPNNLLSGDPNSLLPDDPNYLDDISLQEPDQLPKMFLLKQNIINVGPVVVDIEIYDENSKMPMLWTLKSPFTRKAKNIDNQPMQLLANLLKCPKSTLTQAQKLTRKINRSITLPDSETFVYKRTSYSRGSRIRGRNRRQKKKVSRVTWRTRRIGGEPPIVQAREDQRRSEMADFASQWRRQLKTDDDYQELLAPLPQLPGSFNDYIGRWGHNRININTAPPEVLQAAFQPLNLTAPMVRAIVRQRDKSPLKTVGQLTHIEGIDQSILRPLKIFTTTQSDTFTVQIKARWGRSQYNMFAGIYRNRKGQLTTHAVFTGE